MALRFEMKAGCGEVGWRSSGLSRRGCTGSVLLKEYEYASRSPEALRSCTLSSM
jgi:hypothetical protein